jgi:anti-sigma regulatory factor (Ser/Thr protein kinase)
MITIMAGHLTVAIDPPLGGRAYSFVSTVGSALADAGFTTGTRDRVSVILVELLNNVARHADGAASVELQIDHAGEFKSIEISVASNGPGFDVDEMIAADIAKLKSGDREHGLLRVARLAGRVGADSNLPGTSSVHCEVYERPRPDSVLRHSPAVLPICFEYDFPQFLWVGEECYSEDSFELLRAGPAVQDFFFSPLAARGAPWLGLEFTGRVVISDVDPGAFGISDRPDLRFPWTPGPAISNYFRAKFESRRVVVYAYDTPFSVRSSVAKWASVQQLPFFASEPEMMNWLAEITPGPGNTQPSH